VDVEKTIEFILDMQAQAVVNQAKRDEEFARIEKFAERTDRRLDRAIRLAVREVRNERRRRQELDARLTASHARVDAKFEELAEAHRATEAALKAFLTGRGGNGSHGKDSE
jgi:hypothetical protein